MHKAQQQQPGAAAPSGPVCPACNGAKTVKVTKGGVATQVPCYACNGTGVKTTKAK